VKAGAGKAPLGGIENLQPAVGLPLGISAPHLEAPRPRRCNAINENERSLS
jgi:hypothetical protein